MTWEVLVTVFTFGGLGAVVRGIVIYILASTNGIFPISIVIVNMLAAFLGAFISSMVLPLDISLSLVAGLVGGIGTLSSINVSILDLIFDRGFRRLGVFLLLTIVLGLLLAAAGTALGSFTRSIISNQFDTPSADQQALQDLLKMMEEDQAQYHDHEHTHTHIQNLEQQIKDGVIAIDPPQKDEANINLPDESSNNSNEQKAH